MRSMVAVFVNLVGVEKNVLKILMNVNLTLLFVTKMVQHVETLMVDSCAVVWTVFLKTTTIVNKVIALFC